MKTKLTSKIIIAVERDVTHKTKFRACSHGEEPIHLPGCPVGEDAFILCSYVEILARLSRQKLDMY